MNNPLVTVCIPAYNDALDITKNIKSVLEQSYKNIEIIICDDKSTDETFEILTGLSKSDERIRLYKNDVNLGWLENSNKVLSLASGDFVFTCQGDDYYSSDEYINDAVKIFTDNPTVGVIHFISPKDNCFFREYGFINADNYAFMISACSYMPAPTTTAYRNEVLKKTRYYGNKEKYWTGEVELSLQLASLHYDAYIAEDKNYFFRYTGNLKDSVQVDKLANIALHVYQFYKNVVLNNLYNDLKLNLSGLEETIIIRMADLYLMKLKIMTKLCFPRVNLYFNIDKNSIKIVNKEIEELRRIIKKDKLIKNYNKRITFANFIQYSKFITSMIKSLIRKGLRLIVKT